jgi:diguanylate cyclase (GGDEF)-like protein
MRRLQLTPRRALLATSAGSAAAIYGAFLLYETPGLGIGHFYYVAVALVALAGGPRSGIAAGLLADALYAGGIVLNPSIPSADVLSVSTGMRLVTFTGIGALIGWFAAHNRDLVRELGVLAERDFLTGLPNTRAFEAAIARRFASGRPFALLLGDMDRLKAINDADGHAEGNDALRRLADMLGSALRPEDELARVGGDEFAVLTSLSGGEEAARLCARLEAQLAERGTSMTFGWALFPIEGENALSLYRAADERLYARKLVRGDVRTVRGALYSVS